MKPDRIRISGEPPLTLDPDGKATYTVGRTERSGYIRVEPLSDDELASTIRAEERSNADRRVLEAMRVETDAFIRMARRWKVPFFSSRILADIRKRVRQNEYLFSKR